MKKFLYAISWILCAVYIVWFSLNVSDLVSKHMDFEVSYPLYTAMLSVVLLLVMLIIGKFKGLDKKLFFIPLLFFASAVITFIIGCLTPCEFCTL